MIIDKLNVINAKAYITAWQVPTYDDIWNLPGEFYIKEDWWTQDGFLFTSTGIFTYPNLNEFKGIRPIIHFKNTHNAEDENRLDVGDEFLLNNYLFTVYQPEQAICNTVVGFSPFQAKNEQCTTRLDTTLMKNWDKFHNSLVGKSIRKVVKKIPYEFSSEAVKDIKLPSVSDFDYSIVPNIPMLPYWLRDRKDEFTAQFIDRNGSIQETSIFDNEINVCPALYLNPAELNNKTNLETFSLFEFENKVYKIITDISLSPVVALSLNTIGFSCYSTGIMDITPFEEEEEEYYEASEVHQIIKNYYNKLI